MLKISSSHFKIAQDWRDEIRDVDWIDGGPDHRPPRPTQNQGVVNEGNLNDYLVDDIEQSDEEPKIQKGRHPVPTDVDEIRDEIPTSNESLGIPEGTPEIPYQSGQQLLYDAMDRSEVVSFEYTNRHGNYAGRRVVEPHYAFPAPTTGNEVVVTLDRDTYEGPAIRAFIIGNIHPGGVRYEGVTFNPRGEIMRGVA